MGWDGGAYREEPVLTPYHHICGACGEGRVVERRRYRFGLALAVLGHVVLLPSLVGIAFGTMGLVASGTWTQEVARAAEREARASLEAAGVPASYRERTLRRVPIPPEELSLLPPAERLAVDRVRVELASGTLGAGAGTLPARETSLAFLVASLAGALAGCALVRRRTLHACGSCGAPA